VDESIVVIVTGAAGGLGRAMSLGLLAAGRRVVAFDIDRARPAMDELVGLAHGAGQSERLFPVYGSVRSEDDCARVVAAAIERFGRVDALVNNAGLGMGTISLQAMISGIPFYDVPAENWRALIDTNVNGPFLMAKAITPHLRKQGWGRIVNVTTSYPTMIKDGFSPYGPAKAALEAASVIWSNDLKGTGVTVNVLIPGGAADTPMVPYEAARDRTKLVPPHVMVAPVTWLTSRASDGFSGYRFIAREWDPDAPVEQNVKKAGSLAGWRGAAPSGVPA
jgi:NAD(P)-dependent dehydrogenase (short-subunit alcohol dehydrogenase family)